MSSKHTRRMRTPDWSALNELLTEGGDERIRLDPDTRRNRYGCGVEPEIGGADFASTTASTISAAALDHVGTYLDALPHGAPRPAAYAWAAQQTREDLARLCGQPPRCADNIVLAPSGTDLHLIAADLARGSSSEPLGVAMADPSETGRGAPFAVRSQRFGVEAPHGPPSQIATLLPGATAGKTAAVSLRAPDGRPRSASDVDADFDDACRRFLRAGRRVLLVLVDVSKTGLIAPSPACALDLKRRYGDRLTVLVDACQFRLSPASLAAYLAADFLVAVTGSKFVGGPAFSGALILPEGSAAELRNGPLLPALGDFSGREDWPGGFAGRRILPELPNFGMLARWRAALFELAAFRALPPGEIRSFLARFGREVESGLEAAGPLTRIEAPPLRRLGGGGWDTVPTIFTFRVEDGGRPLVPSRLEALYERLRHPPAGGDMAVRLGQPVTVGWDGDQPRMALRISASARLIEEALTAGDGGEAVIARAVEALEITARQARRV